MQQWDVTKMTARQMKCRKAGLNHKQQEMRSLSRPCVYIQKYETLKRVWMWIFYPNNRSDGNIAHDHTIFFTQELQIFSTDILSHKWHTAGKCPFILLEKGFVWFRQASVFNEKLKTLQRIVETLNSVGLIYNCKCFSSFSPCPPPLFPTIMCL